MLSPGLSDGFYCYKNLIWRSEIRRGLKIKWQITCHDSLMKSRAKA
ncbi:hypothetical protein A2U01_0098067, partial [Trifolium medium]|nr:hypothetical protein [Trifolium medium]